MCVCLATNFTVSVKNVRGVGRRRKGIKRLVGGSMITPHMYLFPMNVLVGERYQVVITEKRDCKNVAAELQD